MIFAVQPKGDRPPLFAVHILGGRASYYKTMSQHFGTDQPVIGVSFGMLARDKPIGVEQAAQRYFEEIQEYYPEGPIHLAAVSLGSYFAWELAWLLHDAGREIGHFALFDAEGPDGRDKRTGMGRIWANLRTIQHRGIGSIPVALQNRVNEFRQRRIAKKMEQQAEEGERIEIKGGDDFIASNELEVSKYEPKPLDVPVTIYRSDENFFDTRRAIRNGLGWKSVAKAGYKVVDVPGGHLTMLDPPHVEVLASHIKKAMDAA